jgi:hypothetical protein
LIDLAQAWGAEPARASPPSGTELTMVDTGAHDDEATEEPAQWDETLNQAALVENAETVLGAVRQGTVLPGRRASRRLAELATQRA